MTNKKLFNSLRRVLFTNSVRLCSVDTKTPIISCKDKSLNFYGQIYPKNEEIPLASKNWYHRGARGDYFIIHRGVQDVQPEVYSAHSFDDTGLSPHIIQAIEKEDIIMPTNIQYRSIHKILAGHNTMITAETGCGKTLAYVLPLLNQVIKKKAESEGRPVNSPLGVILTPSRELVNQIYDVLKPLCRTLDLDVRELVGGFTQKKISNPVIRNLDIIVATPGIFSKFLTYHLLNPNHIMHVVLDEADTLLDDSFEFKLTGLLRKIYFRKEIVSSKGAQLTLVSATVPSDLPIHLSPFMSPDSIVKIVSKDAHKTLPNLPQRFLRIGSAQKPIQLLKIIRGDVHKKHPVMIFSNKTKTCDWLSCFLNENSIKSVSVNGDMSVTMRMGKYDQFYRGDVDVLSCTDMLSRGMDTIRTRHVVNYDFPISTFDYIHRIGRTGRIGSSHGCQVTNFVSKIPEVILAQKIEMSVRKLKDLPSVDGNIKKVLRNQSYHSIEKAKNELKSLASN